MKIRFRYWVLLGVAVLLIACAVTAGLAWRWVHTPLQMSSDRVDFVVEPGSTPRQIARTLTRAGAPLWEEGFGWLARFTKLDKQIKAGGYEATPADTPIRLLERLARGDMSQRQLTFVEGWTFKQMRAALDAHPDVNHTLTGVSDEAIMRRLGADVKAPEGMFFPDTYIFTPGSSDFDILRRAYEAGQQVLAKAWAQRSPDLPLKTPYEALILASIVEKETGHGADRARIAGVFINRLRKGMLLQTDPTVIYGMGDAYDGQIRKRDLQTDTPWNTYTRVGLPPTPIAAPGRAALTAALHPEKHDFFYFVSRGNGTSEFSTNLGEHNRNVSRYILRKSP